MMQVRDITRFTSWCTVELPISGVSLLITRPRPPQPSQKEASFTSFFFAPMLPVSNSSVLSAVVVVLQFSLTQGCRYLIVLLRRTHHVDQSINYTVEIPILVTRNCIQTRHSVEDLRQGISLLRVLFCNTMSSTN